MYQLWSIYEQLLLAFQIVDVEMVVFYSVIVKCEAILLIYLIL